MHTTVPGTVSAVFLYVCLHAHVVPFIGRMRGSFALRTRRVVSSCLGGGVLIVDILYNTIYQILYIQIVHAVFAIRKCLSFLVRAGNEWNRTIRDTSATTTTTTIYWPCLPSRPTRPASSPPLRTQQHPHLEWDDRVIRQRRQQQRWRMMNDEHNASYKRKTQVQPNDE